MLHFLTSELAFGYLAAFKSGGETADQSRGEMSESETLYVKTSSGKFVGTCLF
jgi:hypothetical protein